MAHQGPIEIYPPPPYELKNKITHDLREIFNAILYITQAGYFFKELLTIFNFYRCY